MKISFSDFWIGFNQADNFIIDYFKVRGIEYVLTTDVAAADLLFFSMFGREHVRARGLKVLYSGESDVLPLCMFDFCISMNLGLGTKNYYLPHWAIWDKPEKLLRPKIAFEEFKNRRDCCIIIGNSAAKERISFFQKLSNLIRVDSGGSFMNNVGRVYSLPEKHSFISNYKFIICFENKQQPGYCTEKLYEAMLCNVIPIYFGDPEVGKYFNVNSFINIDSIEKYDLKALEIFELLRNPDKLFHIWNENWVRFENYKTFLNKEDFFRFLDKVIIKKPASGFVSRIIRAKVYYLFIDLKFKLNKWKK